MACVPISSGMIILPELIEAARAQALPGRHAGHTRLWNSHTERTEVWFLQQARWRELHKMNKKCARVLDGQTGATSFVES